MKVYRRHYCEARHRRWTTLAKCLWPRAAWIAGTGPYATVAWCRVPTVQLHMTAAAAEAALDALDVHGCGGRCYRHHELIVLAPDWKIGR